MNTKSAIVGVSAVTATGSLTASVRSNLSISHLLAATSFSRAVGAIEAANTGKTFGDFWEDIQASAIACVLTASAGLEAYANELFVDHPVIFPDLRPDVMAKLWELYEMKRTLEKFEFALFLLQASPFNRGASPYDDAAALTKLRNALVHFKPEWSTQQTEHAKVSAALQNRASRSPFFGTNEQLFPRAWASHKSTRWVVQSVVALILDFEGRCSFQSRITPYLERLRAT